MGSFDYSSWAAQTLQEADDATYALNPRGFGSDVGTALKQGVLGLPSMVTGLADIPLGLLGANRPISTAATRLGELTGIEPAKWAKLLDQNYSRATQEGKRDIQAAWDDPNTGALDIAKAYASNPRTTALNAIESVPSMAAGWGMGGLLGKAAGVTSAAVRAGIGEGSVGAGQMMAQIDPTVDPRIAALASLAVGGGTAAISGGSARLAQKLGISDIDTMAVGGVRGASDVSLPIYKRVPIGMLQEGLVEEGSQSGLEQLSKNWAENKPLTQGLARNILEGTLAGSPFGAIGGAIPARLNERPEIKPDATPPLQIGFNPMAGVPIVFPDGSATLNSEQELSKRYTPVVSKPPLSTTEDIANRVNSNEATLDVVTSGNKENADAQDLLQKQMKEYVKQAESEIKKTRAEFGLDKKESESETAPRIDDLAAQRSGMTDPVQALLDQATNLIGAPNASTTSTVLPADSIAADVGIPDAARGMESGGGAGYGPDVTQSAVNSGMLGDAPLDPAGILANAVTEIPSTVTKENANEKATQTNANEGQETGQKETLLTPAQAKPISEPTGQPVAEIKPSSAEAAIKPTSSGADSVSQPQGSTNVSTSAQAVKTEEKGSTQPEPAAAAVAPQGKQVSQFNGKYGKGMNESAAKLKATELNSANTDKTVSYAAEEHNDPKLENPWSVVGRKVKPVATSEQIRAMAPKDRPARTDRIGDSTRNPDAEAQASAAAQAKKEANKGKSVRERLNDAILDRPTKLHPNAGLGTGTRRESMQAAVDQERYIQQAMVHDQAAKKRDEETVDRGRRDNMLAGFTNPNLPGMKEINEAAARLKTNKYEKPEYRVYEGRDKNGAFREISKTEYDYAQELKAKPGLETDTKAAQAEALAAEIAALSGHPNLKDGLMGSYRKWVAEGKAQEGIDSLQYSLKAVKDAKKSEDEKLKKQAVKDAEAKANTVARVAEGEKKLHQETKVAKDKISIEDAATLANAGIPWGKDANHLTIGRQKNNVIERLIKLGMSRSVAEGVFDSAQADQASANRNNSRMMFLQNQYLRDVLVRHGMVQDKPTAPKEEAKGEPQRIPGPSGYDFPASDLVSRVQGAFEITHDKEVTATAIGDVEGGVNFGLKNADGRYYILSKEKSIGFDGKGKWSEQGKPEVNGTYDPKHLESETIRVLTEQGAIRRTEPTQSAQPAAKTVGKIDGEVYSATGSKPTAQLPIPRIEQIVKEITAKVSGSVPILVVESPESIGLTVAPDVVASGVTLADGNIYVFQSGVGSVLDVQRVVFHELFHRGLQNVMTPADYLATMLDLAAKDSRVQEYANNWKNSNSGTDQLAKYKEQGLTGAELNNRYEGLAIEEGLAQVAEELKSDGEVGSKYKHIQKLLSWIAGVADKLGMSKLAKSIRVLSYGDAEKFVMDMIGKAGGVAQYGSGIRLSAKNAPTSIPAHLVDMAAHYGGNTGLQAATDATNIVSKAIDMMTSLPDIIRRYKDQLPSAKEWHDAMLVKEERKNAIKQMVDAVAAQVSKLTAKEYDVVNAFVYDSTFQQKWGYDPEFKRKTTVDPEFKARFDSLSPAVQKVAKDIFAHGEYVRNTQRAIMDDLKISDVFLTKKQLEGPYAALRRFGDYAVVLKSDKLIAAEAKAKGTDPNSDEHQALDALKRSGDDYSYSRFDTAGQAAVFLKEQLATGKFKGYTFPHKHGLDTPMTMPADVLRRVLASINADTNTSDDIRNVMVENIKGMYFRTMEDRLARQAQQQRKYIRGADTNMIRSFMAQGEADANFLSILEHGGEVNSAIYQVQKEGDKGAKENKKIADLVIAHHIEASKPKMSPIQDRLVAATSAMQLSSSLGYHLSNMTQVVQVSLPKLAAEFNDYTGAWDAVTNGYKLYHSITSGNILSGKALDLSKVKNEGLRNVLQHAIDRQLLDVGMEGDLTQFDRFQTGYSVLDGTSSIASKVLYKLRQISRGVELMNRIATTAAAYSMYMEKRGGEPGASSKAQDFAVEMLETTQGDMSGLAAPIAIKKLPKVIVQYRKYQLMMVALYVDGFNKAFRGETPEVRALGRRFLAYKLFHTGMAAGVLGMPMLNIVGPAFAFLFGDDDEPKDFERMMRDLIGNTALSDLLLHGPLSLMGLDTSAKLGDEKVFSIMPFTDIDVTSKKGLALTAIGLLGGPAFGQAAHMADGVGMMQQGEYYKGIEKFLPRGLEDAMKGFRMANDGYTLKNGDVMVRPEDISGVALALQTLGLPPTEIKRYQWFQSQQIEITRFFSDQEKRMKKSYSDAKESGDSDSQEKIKDDWRQLQGGKAKARRYFNDSPDELKTRDMSALTNYYTYQSKREKSLQRSIPVSAD